MQSALPHNWYKNADSCGLQWQWSIRAGNSLPKVSRLMSFRCSADAVSDVMRHGTKLAWFGIHLKLLITTAQVRMGLV